MKWKKKRGQHFHDIFPKKATGWSLVSLLCLFEILFTNHGKTQETQADLSLLNDKPNVHLLTRHHVTYALTVHNYFSFIVLLFKLIVSIVHALAMSHPFMYLYL
jgi:hypothetical protein